MERKVSLFSTCKKWVGIFNNIQTNAFSSWSRLKCEVLIFGLEEGTSEKAQEFGFRHFAGLKRSESGVPLLDSLFKGAEQHARNDILCYVNSDIILSGLVEAVQLIPKGFGPFLMVGQRRDADNLGVVGFGTNWQESLRKKSVLHQPHGVDYFCFTRGLYKEIPPFALGQFSWDNYLVLDVLNRDIPVIDATEIVLAVHQDHPTYPRGGKEYVKNRELFEFGKNKGRGHVTHATWTLGKEGLQKK